MPVSTTATDRTAPTALAETVEAPKRPKRRSRRSPEARNVTLPSGEPLTLAAVLTLTVGELESVLDDAAAYPPNSRWTPHNEIWRAVLMDRLAALLEAEQYTPDQYAALETMTVRELEALYRSRDRQTIRAERRHSAWRAPIRRRIIALQNQAGRDIFGDRLAR